MTFTGVTTGVARYCIIDKIVYYYVQFSGTLGGTAAGTIIVSLPVTAISNYFGGSCYINDTGGYNSGVYLIQDSGTTLYIERGDSTFWSLGSGRGGRIQGFYEVA